MRKSDVVKLLGGQYVWIDTCYTLDHGWETMVFECDENGNVISWWDLDSNRYTSEAEAAVGHERMVGKWQDKWAL